MKAKDISFLFIVGTICVLLLVTKVSVMTITLVCIVCGVAYVYRAHMQSMPLSNVGKIIQINDISIQKVRDVLDTWSEYDTNLYLKQTQSLDKLFDLYADLLMNAPETEQELLQKYDLFLDVRNELIDDSYEWVFKNADIPPDLDETLSKPMLSLVSRYMNILENKYPVLIRHPRSIYGN